MIRKVFQSFDHDNNGRISADELRSKLNIPAEEIQRFLISVDLNKDGEIDENEFWTLIEKRFLDSFLAFDKNGDGYITYEEMKHTFANLGLGQSDRDIQEYLEELDTNKDGKVSLDEYIEGCFISLGFKNI